MENDFVLELNSSPFREKRGEKEVNILTKFSKNQHFR
jgi:hypothetical protein